MPDHCQLRAENSLGPTLPMDLGLTNDWKRQIPKADNIKGGLSFWGKGSNHYTLNTHPKTLGKPGLIRAKPPGLCSRAEHWSNLYASYV